MISSQDQVHEEFQQAIKMHYLCNNIIVIEGMAQRHS